MLCPTFEKRLAANMKSFRTMKMIRSSDVIFKVMLLDENFCITSHDFLIHAIFCKFRVFLALMLCFQLVALENPYMTTLINFF